MCFIGNYKGEMKVNGFFQKIFPNGVFVQIKYEPVI